MATAIEFDNIGKQYRLGLVSTQTISNDLKRWWYMNILNREDPFLKIGETNDRSKKGASEYVWALKDVNFKVEQGDVVGIIGKNGAGKSTLLKLLSRITSPTTGEIRARGRIGSLLEVGTGFHPEMTGMENIFLNGAILGMSKREIKSKLDEIIDFSGCERYIDTPVKRYSSGMMVRLGFAVAAHLDPEILVVDEVLAVGDAEFQKKAIGKMKDVSQGEGRTVLFVSHNMASIKKLCKSCVMLKNGTIHKIGETDEVIDEYLSENLSMGSVLNVAERTDREGNQKAKFVDISFFSNNKQSDYVLTSEPMDEYLTIEAKENIDDVVVFTGIFRVSDSLHMIHSNTSVVNLKVNLHKGINKIKCSFSSVPLQPGSYYINVALMCHTQMIDRVVAAADFSVVENDVNHTGRLQKKGEGVVIIPTQWKTL